MDIRSIELQAHLRLAETGLTAAELLSMDMDEYARVTGRPTAGDIAASIYEPPIKAPETTPAPPVAQEPSAPQYQGIDVASLDMEQYAAVRGRLGMGQSRAEGRGIFDSVSSRSDEYTTAARVQAGRTAWTTSNVVESPRIARQFIDPQENIDTRPGAARLSNPANMWQG